MSDGSKVSIAELSRIVSEMTDQPPWRQGYIDRDKLLVHDPNGLAGPVLGERVVMRANKMFPFESNVAGVAALVNAAPALLEFASAVFAVWAAKKQSAAARFAWSRAEGEPDESARLDLSDEAEKHLASCLRRLDVSLDKVAP